MRIKHQQKVKEGQLVKMRERIRKGIGNQTNQKLGENEEEGPAIMVFRKMKKLRKGKV